ncbi:MAG: tRNA-specific 2-thiouridylase [Parcubacteria group bacterium LiPW_39]|nr:MAG: tRNA-specific 2-thiouridylase [Parcubacteria group bacterium LiPW_39]
MSAERRGNENLCCSAEAEKAARLVAAKLKIPFYVFNFAKEFKKEVVDYFLDELARGRTPNPCAVCNKKIKFGLLFKKALALGADFIATGHYARIKKDVILSPKGEESRADAAATLFRLFVAKDKNKDQSYFLYQLNQKQLSRIIFPMGDYTKERVYQMAKKWCLPYRQEESFDLCFVGSDTGSFIKKYLKLKSGKIIGIRFCHSRESPAERDESGNPESIKSGFRVKRGMTISKDFKVLGEHRGLALYTIGQRKNLVVPNGPWWVVKKDNQKNILYVSNDEKDLYGGQMSVSRVNWIDKQAPKLPMRVRVKIRYKSEAAEAIIRYVVASPAKRGEITPALAVKIRDGHGVPPFANGGTPRHDILAVKFRNSQRAVTPGQSAVLYSGRGEILGGGVII